MPKVNSILSLLCDRCEFPRPWANSEYKHNPNIWGESQTSHILP